MAVAVPLIGAFSRRMADRIERKHGPTRTSKALDQVGRVARSPKQRKQQGASTR
jgi:hypothetical protein